MLTWFLFTFQSLYVSHMQGREIEPPPWRVSLSKAFVPIASVDPAVNGY